MAAERRSVDSEEMKIVNYWKSRGASREEDLGPRLSWQWALLLLLHLLHLLVGVGCQRPMVATGLSRRIARFAPELAPRIVQVPGARADLPAPKVVLPYDGYTGNLSLSYVIDNRRFVEAVATRCLASTVLEDPGALEPSFVLIKPGSELRLNATAPSQLIMGAGFEPHKRTTILVHGFTQSYPSTVWLRRARALFEVNLAVERQNLIVMDWGRASSGSYAQVAAHVSAMGSFLANFVQKLLELGADRMSLHIIGHSLGAHVAGFAGKRTRPRLGRITALDPAGPCFGKIFSNSPQDRLSADDAFEVDVYHYDDDFLGLPGQHGQFDVYVNGGSKQPGCDDNVNAIFQALLTMVFRRNRVLSESHTRSTEVATKHLEASGCQQVAYECRDYLSFTQGECATCDEQNSQCFFMGFAFQYGAQLGHQLTGAQLRTSFPGKRLYISTGQGELLCLHHYQILVRFEPNAELAHQAKRNKWRLQLQLHSDQQKRLEVGVANLMAPLLFSHLLLIEAEPPARVLRARLQLRADGGATPINLQQWAGAKGLRLVALEVNFMSNINPSVRRALSSRLCPSGWWPEPSANPNSNPNSNPNLSPSPNAIADSSGATQEQWMQLDEC